MSTMKGVWVDGTTQTLKDFPIPEPGPDEVLIKVAVAAQNPKDWKVPELVGCPPAIQGSDIAGTIVKVGNNVTRFKPHDRVASLNKVGAFAEYAVFPALTTFHIPTSLSFEEAATLPLGITTAAMGLFRRLPFTLDSKVDKTIVIWGASGSVGNYAVQMAKIIGLKVIGVAGGGTSIAKIAGADVIVDYRQGQIHSQIKRALNGEKLQFAFDAVSENGTIELVSSLIEKDMEDARVVLVLFPNDEVPDYISFIQTNVFSCYGLEQKFGPRTLPASPEDKAFAVEFFERLEEWLREGKIIPNKITVVPGGLEGVKEGFRRMREKEVSGEKLVFRISETPGL